MRPWSLSHLTVIGVRPAELVETAARAGYDSVDPIFGIVDIEGLPVVPLKAGDPDTVLMAQALKANGIGVNTADGFVLDARTDLETVRRAVALAADLGARNVNALLFDDDRSRGITHLAALDHMAADAGLTLTIEFLVISSLATAQDAMDAIAETGSANIRLMFDALHLAYSGGGPADMRRFGESIGGAQLVDAPATMSFEEYNWMTIQERLAPGDGELPLGDFMAALPPDMVCAIEVPRLDEPDLVARAKRMLDAGRALDRRTAG